jgi:PhnB protein
MKCSAYLTFQGNCEEALNTYSEIFHGEIGTLNRYDNPAMPVPEAYNTKIMHSQLTFDGNIIMCCDAVPGLKVQYGNGISLTITVETVKQTEEIFNKLSEDGIIIVSLEKQFWGSWFGQVKDRFGISWMLMCESA